MLNSQIGDLTYLNEITAKDHTSILGKYEAKKKKIRAERKKAQA